VVDVANAARVMKKSEVGVARTAFPQMLRGKGQRGAKVGKKGPVWDLGGGWIFTAGAVFSRQARIAGLA
jgi:hypothetical protein